MHVTPARHRIHRTTMIGLAALIAVALAIVGLPPAGAAGADGSSGKQPLVVAGQTGRGWVASWGSSPVEAGASGVSATGFTDQTVRDVVHLSLGGNRVRVRLSNAFGTKPLKVNDAHVALQRSGAQVYPHSDRQVRFGGRKAFTIPVGAEVYSDPIALRVKAGQNLAVSMYFRGATGPATWHPQGLSTNYYSTSGNHADDAGKKAYVNTVQSWFFLEGVDVRNKRSAGAVVAFGDSITDGNHSTIDANRRWPDVLAGRIYQSGRRPLSVVNSGISGNRILTDAGTSGVTMQARFNRDVLSQTGVRDVIFLEGINDIRHNLGADGTEPVTARELIAGMQSIIRRAHEHDLQIFGGTLTPYKGSGSYTAEGERKRIKVNRWIRTSGAFDGVIDFDQVTRDPEDPQQFLPAYDSGDHLHPDDAGYQAMGEAIPLRLLYQR